MKRTMLILSLCCVAATASAEIYKWKDADGRIHYSDTPPPDQKKAKVIDTKAQPVSSLPADRKTAAPAAAAATDGAKPADAAKADPATAQKDPAACDAAQKRSAFLQNNKIYKAINEKGEVEFMEAERRKQEIAKNEEDLKKFCP
ncbi:MAG TPA: DUF4124 domain-containing protein [Chitinolyticbacter sp.]|nr:DUF4124 domain-containing protein [Chitinolyticbacter sp.]